jgi:hypothetical protein
MTMSGGITLDIKFDGLNFPPSEGPFTLEWSKQ